jgi:hypothetical protein
MPLVLSMAKVSRRKYGMAGRRTKPSIVITRDDRMVQRAILAYLILLGHMGAAQATGNLDCKIEDKSLNVAAEAVVTYGRGRSIVGFRTQADIRLKDMPDDMKNLTLGVEHLAHHWLRDRDAKLLLFWEQSAGSDASVEIIIETRRSNADDAQSSGTYQLTVSLPSNGNSKPRILKANGRARCWLG